MAREYSRAQRVADHLQRELAELIQHAVRDPRLGMVSVTGVEVSRDLGYAKVFYTLLGCESDQEAADATGVLNRASGFLRTQLSQDSSMRTVPRLRFYFDNSVGRGRFLEDLIGKAAAADRKLGLREDELGDEGQS